MSPETKAAVDMDTCSELHVCSDEYDLGKKLGHVFAIDFFVYWFFLYGILFDARGESCMWPSQTPVSVVTPPSCVWASLIQLIIFHIRSVHGTLWLSAWRTEIPFVSTIYCLHNTGFWFVRLVVVYWVYLLLHERLQSHFHNSNDLKGLIWNSRRVKNHWLYGINDL